MRSEKGFTIVELLGVITLLGVIVAVAIGSVMFIVGGVEDNYYKTQEDLIIISAREYYLNNPYLLSNDGSEYELDFSVLVDIGYIEMIKDHNGEECQSITVNTKYNDETREYDYKVYWECSNYTKVKE